MARSEGDVLENVGGVEGFFSFLFGGLDEFDSGRWLDDFRLFREEGAAEAEGAWAAKGCFNVTSTRVFSDQFCQKKHSPYETLRRDDHLGPKRMSL